MPDPATMLSFDPTTAPGPAVAPVAASGSPQDFLSRTLAIDADLKAGKLNAAPSTAPAPQSDAPPIVGPSDSPIRDANNFLETAADQAISGIVGFPRALLRAGDFINRNLNGAEPGATGHDLDTAGSFLPSPEGTFNVLAKDSGGVYVPQSELGKLAQGATAAAMGGALVGVPVGALPAAAASGAGSVLGAQALPNNPELGGVLGGFIAPTGELALRAPIAAGRSVLEPLTRPFAGKDEPLVDAQTGAPVLRGSVTGNPDDLAPITAKPGVVQIAAAKLRAAAADPDAAKAALNQALTTQQGAAATDLVPGSLPTTFQVTGDTGLGQFERAAARANGDIATAREAGNNAARVNQLEAQAPDGDPAAVGALVRNQLDALTKQDQATVAAARQAVADKTNASSVVAPGGDATALQQYGEALRGGAAPNDEAASNLLAARNATKAQEAKLWALIDPDNSLTVNMTPIRDRAQAIADSLPKNAAPLVGDEAAIVGTAKALPDVQPFQELTALRSRLTDAMAEELRNNGSTQSYRRMSQLLDSVHQAMEGGAAAKATQDAQAVAAGKMSPGEAIMARLGQELSKQAPAGVSEPDGLGSGGVASANDAGGTPPGDARPNGGGLQGSERLGVRSGDSAVATSPAARVAEPALATFDADAAARYQAARNFTAQELHGKFTNAPGVGEVLAPGRTQSEFRVQESQVPAKLFKPGAGGSERVQAYVAAGGDPKIMQDYALYSLRKAAQNADGTLDPAKSVAWQKSHSDALSALEQAAPGFTKDVQSLTRASQMVQDATARAADRVKAIQTSAAGKFLGEADPVSVMGRILSGDKAAPEIRQIIKTIKSDKDADGALTQQAKDAQAGLKKAAAEYIMRKALGNAEAGGANVIKSDVYQTLIKKAEPALRALYGDEKFENLDRIARDLQRANKSVQGTKVGGGSDTAQNLAAQSKHSSGDGSVLHQVILAEALDKIGEVVAGVAHATGPVVGPVVKLGTTVGGLVYQAMREAGLTKAQELAEQAVFSPQLAKILLEHVPAKRPNPQLLRRFTVQLTRAMVAAAQPHAKDQ